MNWEVATDLVIHQMPGVWYELVILSGEGVVANARRAVCVADDFDVKVLLLGCCCDVMCCQLRQSSTQAVA